MDKAYISNKDLRNVVNKYIFDLHELYQKNLNKSYIDISYNEVITDIWNELHTKYKFSSNYIICCKSKITIFNMKIHISSDPHYFFINNKPCINVKYFYDFSNSEEMFKKELKLLGLTNF